MYKYIDGIADVEIEGNENLYIEIGELPDFYTRTLLKNLLMLYDLSGQWKIL